MITPLQNFGSLVLTVTTTTRKFFTILASVVWFGHELSLTKWIAVALVFAGLSIEIISKYAGHRPPTKAKEVKKTN